MSTTVQAAKKSLVGRVAAVSALGVIGAAGLSVAPASAMTPGGSQNDTSSENVSLTSSKSADGAQSSGSEIKADFAQNTTYVYYNNAVKANLEASQFDNSNFNISEDAAFSRDLQNSMSSYLNWLGGKR